VRLVARAVVSASGAQTTGMDEKQQSRGGISPLPVWRQKRQRCFQAIGAARRATRASGATVPRCMEKRSVSRTLRSGRCCCLPHEERHCARGPRGAKCGTANGEDSGVKFGNLSRGLERKGSWASASMSTSE
jgi:hypothetical protein